MSRRISLIQDYYNARAKGYSEFSAKYRSIDRSKVIDLLRLENGVTVLDAGCGSGYFALPIKELGCEVYGVDQSPEMIKAIKELGIDGSVASIEEMNIDRQFDRIICYGVLEFVDDVDESLVSLCNHLSDEGLLLVGAPSKVLKSIPYFFYHLLMNRIRLKILSENQMRRKLESSGLEVFKMEKINSLDRVYLCRKKNG